ncbi:hypothetical protein B9Z19DRAFT_1134108 [Tuber borchii]|uniref:Peptidase A2 domain-containing protein n=1 Tax=Tuber borchii TaxID=42251 RepID=A0A2T6ZES7_TUBBO|nr:hypothetical protein B9Z19DRAFT_1134108 [Tuber borchii]
MEPNTARKCSPGSLGNESAEESDVLLLDVTEDIYAGDISRLMGVSYLSQAPDLLARDLPVEVGAIIYGPNGRTITSLIVTYKGNSRWVFFLIDTGAPKTFLSLEAYSALGIPWTQELGAWVTIAGRATIVCQSPVKSHFAHVNILGTDFVEKVGLVKLEDYSRKPTAIYFTDDARGTANLWRRLRL